MDYQLATHVHDETNAALNNNTGTSFIDSTNCAVCECTNTTGLSNSGFESSEMDVSTTVTITELDSPGSSGSNGNGSNSNSSSGLSIGAVNNNQLHYSNFIVLQGITTIERKRYDVKNTSNTETITCDVDCKLEQQIKSIHLYMLCLLV